MTDSLNEQLSACLDGQLPEAELELLLKRMERDSELRHTLGRYSLVGEALRGHGAVRASADFADLVSAAIAAETTTPGRVNRPHPAVLRWLGPAAGAAVAAGVAAVAVFSFQASTPPSAVVAQNPTPDTAADSYIVPANTVSSFMPATRLTNYVVAHSEYSSQLGRRTVLSGVLSEEEEASAATTAPGEDEVAGGRSAEQRPRSDAATQQ